MRHLRFLILACLGVLGCAAGGRASETISAVITGADGEVIGRAFATDSPHGVLLGISVKTGGLAPGAHGLHLHSVGDCSDTGTFKLSKGHINASGKQHGLLNPEGPDNADLPNLHIAADGSAMAEMFNWRIRLSSGESALLDEDGSALVIHANPDDHMSQPIGGAGPRVACAVLKR